MNHKVKQLSWVKIEGLTKNSSSAANRQWHDSTELSQEHMVDGSSLKNKLPDVPSIPVVPLVEAPHLASLPPNPAMPGLPVDATGLASIPATPAPNLNKKQKLKVKAQKTIRKGRCLVMRKSV
jgi:hypothetical protein